MNKLPHEATTKEHHFPIIFGKYQIKKEIGRGGMGIVYKAYDTNLKRIVALKILISQEQESTERFLLETETIARLNHQNIVRFYECGKTPKPYFTMEYIEGVTLSYLIKNRSIKPQQLVEVLIVLSEALYYSHGQKIAHRDIKPSNIMMAKNNTVKIMDFGLAKVLNKTKHLSKTGQMMGTISYMSPEQIEGKANYKSDIYSLGATMYEALTYRNVFQGEIEINIICQIMENYPIPPRQLNPDISPYLEAICLKCLQKNPKNRYKDFKQLSRELKNFKNHKPIIAKRYTSWNVLKNFVYKHKIICSSLMIIFIVLAFSLIITMNALKYAEKTTIEAKQVAIQAKQVAIQAKQATIQAKQATMQAKQEKTKTKKALNKVMTILKYSVDKYKVLQKDKKFAKLFSEIFDDLEKYGENHDWNFIKGYMTAQHEKSQKALFYFTQQIKNNPNDFLSLYNRGSLYKNLKKYKQALIDYDEAIKINSEYSNVYNSRGQIYQHLKKYKQSLVNYNKAIQLNPTYENFYNDRGNLYFDLAKYEQALVDYKKSIQLNPNNSNTYNYLARLYNQQKKQKQALLNYKKAIQLNSKNFNGYLNRGIIYRKLKKYDLALADFKNAMQLDPKHLNIYIHRAIVYEALKKYKLALNDYDKTIQLNPQYYYAYINRGSLYHKLKQDEQALINYKKAIQIDPNHFVSYNNIALIYLENKQYKQAIKNFTKVLSIYPNLSRTHHQLHLCYKAMHNKQKAQYHLRKFQKFQK